MLKDLLSTEQDVSLSADIVIVGAGIAGLAMADRLTALGRRVVMLESGGLSQDEEEHPFNKVVQLGKHYGGAEHGRFRCLGGTSTRWGGAMLPFLPADMVTGWPIDYADLAPYVAPVEALFGLDSGPYEDPALLLRRDGQDASYLARLAKWPTFANRNVSNLFRDIIAAAAGPEIWLNAVTTSFDLDASGRIAAVMARSLGGRCLTVKAPEIIIAAGAIESTRLLLLLDRQYGHRLFAPDDVLGRYFHDHLSILAGRVLPKDRKQLNRVAGFRFEGKGMRNLRFEPSERADVRARVPAGFAHIAFSTQQSSGFDALRDVYRTLQKRSRPDAKQLKSLAFASPWLARALWWRFREKRLLYPANAQVELHMVSEQEPIPSSRITLATDKVDDLGLPLAAIDWRLSERDHTGLRAAIDLFAEDWKASNLAALGRLELMPDETVDEGLEQSGGIYHPGGSTRLGNQRSHGVLDRNFKTFAIPNLSVVATSAFPTGGGANPTMMLLMAALRKADLVDRSLRAGPD